mgnify:CR=1 FL=1
MGLAPYGEARYADKIRDNLIDLKGDGSFQLNLDYFGFLDSDTMTNSNFDQLFGGSARKPESRITRREIDLAASIQIVTEQAMLGLVKHAQNITEKQNLCLAGGVALNCVANGRLLREGTFQKIWIQPAAGDAGGALGAALAASHMRFSVPRPLPDGNEDSQQGSYLGPAYSDAEIAAFLNRHEYPHEVIEDDIRRAERIAQHIDNGDIVGFFSGRMEFGPRSLGARSILGDPRNPETQTRMNLKIKFRESFRPFAPSILESRTTDYFDLQYEMMQRLNPAVVGHFDLIRIYDPEYKKRINNPIIFERIERNLDWIQSNDLVLDYNLKGFLKNAQEPYVTEQILSEFSAKTGT